MTRTFGLELLESVLKGYPNIFLKVKLLLVCSSLGSKNSRDVYFLFILLQGKNTKKMNGFQIEIWRLLFLRRGGKWSSQRKTSQSKGENQQQTQSLYGLDATIQTWASLVGGEYSHRGNTLALH